MKILKPIVAGAVGTTYMTLYSYGYSILRGKQFREPVLLAQLLGGGAQKKGESNVKGWLSHYLVGAAFSLSYQYFLKGKFSGNPKMNSIFMGGLYGLLGIAAWKATVKIHPSPPKIDYKEYFAHLLLAHMIFGYFAFGKLEKDA